VSVTILSTARDELVDPRANRSSFDRLRTSESFQLSAATQ